MNFSMAEETPSEAASAVPAAPSERSQSEAPAEAEAPVEATKFCLGGGQISYYVEPPSLTLRVLRLNLCFLSARFSGFSIHYGN